MPSSQENLGQNAYAWEDKSMFVFVRDCSEFVQSLDFLIQASYVVMWLSLLLMVSLLLYCPIKFFTITILSYFSLLTLANAVLIYILL